MDEGSDRYFAGLKNGEKEPSENGAQTINTHTPTQIWIKEHSLVRAAKNKIMKKGFMLFKQSKNEN